MRLILGLWIFLCLHSTGFSQIIISTVNGSRNSSVSVPVTLGTTGVSSWQMDIIIPTGLTYVTSTVGTVTVAAGKSISTNILEPNILRILGFGLNQNTMITGNLLNIQFTISSTATGTRPLNISNVVASSPTATNIPITGINGGVVIIELLPSSPINFLIQ